MRGVMSFVDGRLGNIMFYIAGAATYAKRNNLEYIGYIPVDFKACSEDKSDGTCYNYVQQFKDTVLRKVKMYKNCQLEPPFEKYFKVESALDKNFSLPKYDNVLFYCIFENASCIDHDIALDLFYPRKEIIDEITDLYGDLSDYVSISVRRGDYITVNKNIANVYNIVDKEFYYNVIDKYFKNDKFIVTSDDLDWCKSVFKGDNFVFADKASKNKIETDLYVSTLCRDNIIANSTFSWWGAYLNDNKDKKVIVPWEWYNVETWPDFFANGHRDMDVIVPDEWIKEKVIRER